jgi:TRAP-type C4-dicarboxylate transport system permease small subunit
MPSLTPIAYWYAAIPMSGALIVLFTVEQLVNGWLHGYEHAQPPTEAVDADVPDPAPHPETPVQPATTKAA